jgi:ABC-type transporter Mla subunit MlaD
VAALGEAVTRSGEESESALTSASDAADDFADSLDAAGAAARGAGGAARAAGAEVAAAAEEMAEAAEETVSGWQAVTAALAEYAEKAREISGDIGQALVRAFGSVENAVADFVKSGKLSSNRTSSMRWSPFTTTRAASGGRHSRRRSTPPTEPPQPMPS